MSDEKDAETEEKSPSAAEAEEEDDRARPDVIAKRVAALGEEDQLERIARQEEEKLAERRRKGKKKKGGLEVAASKKLEKIGKRAEPKRSVAVAADADPLIERTAKLSEWAKKNQKTVQLVGGLLAVGLLGTAGYLWYENKRETDASVLLTKAVETQNARVGSPQESDDEDEAPTEQTFESFDKRRDAALEKYREVQKQFGGTGAAILARLAEGSLLLDKREADAAIAAYTDVKNSPLAAADVEVKGRALEGLGFAHEIKARLAPGEAEKHLDEALKAFKELENTVDVKGFKELAMYHQARVHQAKGDKDTAKDLLLKLKERIDKPEETSSPIPTGRTFPYLREVAVDRLREIDPSAAPKMPGAGELTPQQIQKMIEEMKKQGGAGHGGGH